MRKGELESRLLVLVTLGLTAFGLVMVYSATSAAAALGGADPSSYLKRQAVYALLGVALLIGASRFDYRRLKAVAPGLVLSSLALCALVLVAATPPRPLAAGLALACTLGLAAIWLEPYRRARVFSFLHPWHDAQGAGFQTVQALIGLGSGGVFGDGLGQGIQKVNYLPEAHTDMIFAVIGEELGLIGKTALGLAPLTGIPLPFVSYGGSSLVVQLASVGVLLNIAGGHGQTRRAAVPDRGRRDGGTRPARARGGRGAAGARRERDVRRVAGSRRGAARS